LKSDKFHNAVLGLADYAAFSGSIGLAWAWAILEKYKTNGMWSKYTALHLRVAEVLDARGQEDENHRALQSTLALGRTINEHSVVAHSLQSLGKCYAQWSQYDKSKKYYGEGIRVAKDHRLTLDLAGCVYGLAHIETAGEHPKRAIPLYEEALSIFMGAGAVLGQANCRFGMAMTNLANSSRELEACAEIFRQISAGLSLGSCFLLLGNACILNGDFGAAERRYRDLLITSQHTGNIVGEAVAIARLGQLERRGGQRERGREMISEGFDRWLAVISEQNRAREGSTYVKQFLLSEEETSEQYRELAERSLKDIGRFDLVRDWLEFPLK
jgi:tetratricopeptide (TPR) repeat protein